MKTDLRILITGSCGLLGSHLMALLSRKHEVVGIDRHPWWGDRPVKIIQGDLATPGLISATVAEVAPDIIIHCAAMVSVDGCEQSPDMAYACNARITRDLARVAPPQALVVYITTDGIFEGNAPFATEEQLPCPRTVYGRSKLHGEWDVELATKNHLIIRTNFYGWSSGRKPTFAEWLYHALDSGQPLTLFDDFFFTPIYVVDFVERLERLIAGGHRGIVHLCGKERVSKHQFGCLMAESSGYSTANIRVGSIDDAAMVAQRPKDMSLSSERFQKMTGLDVPGCLAGLRRFLADRDRPLSVRFNAFKETHPRAAAL